MRRNAAHPTLRFSSLCLAGALSLAGCSSSDSGVSIDENGVLNDEGLLEEPIPGEVAFATVSGADEVAVVGETGEVLGRVAVGEGPAIILKTPHKLYTANWADDTVSAIDRETLEVTSIAIPGRPYVIATPPAGDFVYVGVNPRNIAVIDTATDSIVRTIETPELAASLIVSPDGQTLYVATLDSIFPGTLRAIDATDGSEVHPRIDVGVAPAWITIHPDGSRVYTLNFLSDDISVVDTESWTIESSVDTGRGSQAIIANVSPDGKTLFVTNHGTAELMAIDTATNTVRGTAPIDGRPVGVQFNPAGTTVYTTDFGPDSLDQFVDVAYLTTGMLTTTGDGYLRAFDVETLEPVGEGIVIGPGATSVVVQDDSEAPSAE